MRVRWQTATGEVNAPAIEQLAAGYDSDEHRRVTVLGDADGRGSLRSPSCHVFLPVSFDAVLTLVRIPDSRPISISRQRCELRPEFEREL